MKSFRLAVQVYCPAWDVLIALSVSWLVTSCPLVEGAAGSGVSPGPSHWNSGLPVTPSGRVTEQVRVTEPPAMAVEVEDETEINRGSKFRKEMYKIMHILTSGNKNIQKFNCTQVTVFTLYSWCYTSHRHTVYKMYTHVHVPRMGVKIPWLSVLYAP